MIKYYKLFDFLNRLGYKKTDLLDLMSSKTIAKLSKGETVTTDTIDKICEYFNCQPGDIMEYVETMKSKLDNKDYHVAQHDGWDEYKQAFGVNDNTLNVYETDLKVDIED